MIKYARNRKSMEGPDMGRGIILYQSKYGATAKYAKWLQECTTYDIAEQRRQEQRLQLVMMW